CAVNFTTFCGKRKLRTVNWDALATPGLRRQEFLAAKADQRSELVIKVSGELFRTEHECPTRLRKPASVQLKAPPKPAVAELPTTAPSASATATNGATMAPAAECKKYFPNVGASLAVPCNG